MIVQYDIKSIRRTCDSVRSSLSALALPATVLSEAAEKTRLHRSDEEPAVRRFRDYEHQCGRRNGWMIHPTQVNCLGHRQSQGAKDADRLQPKGTQLAAPADAWGTRTPTTAGVRSRG